MLKTISVKMIAFTAICIAISFVLSQFKLFSMPMGGSVTLCSMFFIALAGYFYGPSLGITAGVVLGLLDLILGGYFLHPVQVVLDYPLAFGALGLAGFFRNKKYGLIVGYLVGVSGRFIMSFTSGIVFFYNLIDEPIQSLWGSAVYNFPYMAVEAAITVIIISIPSVRNAIEHIKKQSV